MKPIQIHIGRSKKEGGNVDFASEEEDERDLCNRDPCRSEPHTLPVICIVNNGSSCQEEGDDSPVYKYNQQRPQRWRSQPHPAWTSEADHLRI